MTRLLSLALLGALVAALCAASAPVPRPSGEYAIHLPDGNELLLSHFRGKVVVLAFVLTTCPHCQETSQLLSKLYQEYGPRGFQPIDVAFNEDALLRVPSFVKSFNLNFPVGAATREQVLDFLKVPQNEVTRLMVPQLVFIDRKGVVRFQSTPAATEHMHDEKTLRANIELLLNEGAAPKKPVSSAKAKKGAS
jgi:peroxiredoxin